MSDDKYKIFDDIGRSFTISNDGVIILQRKFHYRELIFICISLLLGLTTLVMIGLLINGSQIYGASSSYAARRFQYKQECTEPHCLAIASYISLNMNASADPCTDFHSYACGGWPLPSNHPALIWRQTTVYSLMQKRNREKLESILLSPVKRKVSWAAERKIKVFFRSCIDDYLSAKLNGRPLIKHVVDPSGGAYLFGTSNLTSWDFNKMLRMVHIKFWSVALFDISMVHNHDAPQQPRVKIIDGGLGMRVSAYLNPRQNKTLYEYRKYMTKIGKLLMRDANLDTSTSENKERLQTFVKDVIGFETKLANITRYSRPSPDPFSPRNQMTLSELNRRAGPIDWIQYFKYFFNDPRLADRITGQFRVAIISKPYIFKMTDYLKSIKRKSPSVFYRTLNNYFVWVLASGYAPHLSYEYAHADREYYEATTGRKSFPSVFDSCYDFVKHTMPQALGSLFVRDHFADSSKSQIHKMVLTLKSSLKAQIRRSTWIDKPTQDKAIEKLDATDDKLAYPSYAFDDNKLDSIYRLLNVKRHDYFGNLLSLNQHFRTYWNEYLLKGEDRQWWYAHMFDVHASFYNPWNELLVPAGIMQWPLYQRNLPDYINYGSMGTILAHELIKSVDAWGGHYTKTGVHYDWWTNTTTHQYMKKKDCLYDYYSNTTAGPYYIPLLKRRLSVPMAPYVSRYMRYGIAETGGIRAAFKAYQALGGSAKHLPGLDFTPEQLFFISYAQINCFSRTDTYSWLRAAWGRFPENIRGNGALAQLDEFSKVFNCPAGSSMNVRDKCNIF